MNRTDTTVRSEPVWITPASRSLLTPAHRVQVNTVSGYAGLDGFKSHGAL